MANKEANSETTQGGNYDVFLSFRGPDTRYGFTDCLYVFMSKVGIRIFRDNEELRPGEKISEILRAVKSSQIYIPIFSTNYAWSKWCLQELKCMVECIGQSPEKHILPIFYDVEPSDVKLETELYKNALRKHEEDLGYTLVKPWKEALTKVARIKGWRLKDKGQGEVIEDIIKKVSQMITIRKRDMPNYLVGIDDHIEDIKKLLDCCDTRDVRLVLIYGIGGMGKTTLAKAVFNELSPLFEGRSFLSNIQESSPYDGIVKMQRKLLADLFSFSLAETFDFEDGINIITNRLSNKRVLLVFDGMDENDQFMQLAKHCTSCSLGSRIIITTRDKSVFPMTKVEGLEEIISTWSTKFFMYEMKEMHFHHALQLFNKLAFNTDSAPSDFYDLSREVVKLTGGLPLALEVIGSHLRTLSRETWISTLKKMKEVPHKKVQQTLKISYDALEYRAKQIFLDIACFFVNKKKTNPMYMWEDCGFFPKVEIEVLINKSLIKIVDHDRIWMHDQLRALGREIVRQENMRKPEDESRLWFLETAHENGTENPVALAQWRSGHNFTRKDFANLSNARFLILDGGNFAGNFEDILPKLRWLCWRNCPPKLQIKNFVLNRLVVLKLSGDITTEHWSGWVEIMVASKLKVLKIAGSKSLIKTPRFSEFMTLEILVLKDFLSLSQIDCSIGKLERLIYLKIKCCPSLRQLPKEIGCLTTLRELILIQDFSVRYLPNSIGKLALLSRLVMEDIGLVKLPDKIKGLVDLKYLSLVNCTSLMWLPDAIGKLKSLTELDLSGTNIEELPHSIWNLKDLTLRINSSKIQTQHKRDLALLKDIANCLYHRRRLEPDGLILSADQEVQPLRLRDYPTENFLQQSGTIVVPGFHEHHLSGRCLPKILARLMFSHCYHSWINISVEVPLWDTEIITSSEPIPYFGNLILMLASWSKRKWVSKRRNDFQESGEELLSLEFCDHCMSITSETREFNYSQPCLESFSLFSPLSIVVSMILTEDQHGAEIGCRVQNLKIKTKLPSLGFPPLLLRLPCSSENLQNAVILCNTWHELAIQVRGSVSRRSFKNCTLRRLRKTRRGRLQVKRKRNLSWLCLHDYLDMRLLLYSCYIFVCWSSLKSVPKRQRVYCHYMLEEACALLDCPLDVKQKTHLMMEFALFAKWLHEVSDVKAPPVEEVHLFLKHISIRLLHCCRCYWRRGHYHKTLDADFYKLPNCGGHSFTLVYASLLMLCFLLGKLAYKYCTTIVQYFLHWCGYHRGRGHHHKHPNFYFAELHESFLPSYRQTFQKRIKMVKKRDWR